jgi:hypothetical protein
VLPGARRFCTERGRVSRRGTHTTCYSWPHHPRRAREYRRRAPWAKQSGKQEMKQRPRWPNTLPPLRPPVMTYFPL